MKMLQQQNQLDWTSKLCIFKTPLNVYVLVVYSFAGGAGHMCLQISSK